MLDLRAQIQSDLQWLCSCPDLVDFGSEFPQTAFPSLDDPRWETVEKHLRSRASRRVGYYVEALIEVWLGTIPGISNIQRGIQIQDGKTTRGELDFLYQKDGRLHHLEVALKFFLHLPNPPEDSPDSVSEFPGPNARDDFEKKRNKILHSQLPLGRKCFPEIAESRALVKGMIFYHPLQELPSVLPERMNPNHARGMWIRSTELELLRERFPECRGTIMQKPFWLAGEAASLPLPELTTMLQEHFTGSDSPVFLSLRSGKESGQIEVERLFVVSPAWPESGRSGGR